ncbi:ABC transporter ATP-binding protein [Demequina oxidasica]|uniref:ABC transporter ATP-binding protein n=1 Tax=Demequina oxidasica TaxID=676199 RepID=UPI00078309C5|nr:ABC transporter ATP-binding protein [Demequina oxidasica]
MSAWGARELTVTYGDTVALSSVSVDVREGEVLAVVGGDGAGKTTLLRALAGAVPASAGAVDAPSLSSIGFMPTAAGVWRDLSVDQNIDFVASAQGVTGATLAERREQLLADTGLEGATKRLAGQLSGGMRQKLAFALAMIHRPPMLILDEPSTGVDPVSRVDLWRMISQAAVDGAAIIMATTYLDEAERASRVLVLDGGEVLLAGTPADVMANVPGHVADAVGTPDRARSWRRGSQFKTWSPDEPTDGAARADDLEDAVIAATLAKETSNA